MAQTNKKTVLIFGGNGFIGAEVVDLLLNENEDLELVLVNRGNYRNWDTNERIKSRVSANLICDREKDSLRACLKSYLDRENFQFEAIVDFSAYRSDVIQAVIDDIPAKKIKLYIYISTDSVYEVCVDKQVEEGQKLILKETDSVRPTLKSERERLKKFDSYGHHKFKCEEKLVDQNKNSTGFPYIFLRLPDVVGPRDSEERFWYYQMWLQYLDSSSNGESNLSISIPAFYFEKKTSYVYVHDVARMVHLLLKSNIKNEAFNLGYSTALSVNDVIRLMASCIRSGLEKRLTFISGKKDDDPEHPYPSVTKGPVDVSKAKDLLNFECADLEASFRESVAFYNEAYEKYPTERDVIAKKLAKELFVKGSPQKELFLDFVKTFKL